MATVPVNIQRERSNKADDLFRVTRSLAKESQKKSTYSRSLTASHQADILVRKTSLWPWWWWVVVMVGGGDGGGGVLVVAGLLLPWWWWLW